MPDQRSLTEQLHDAIRLCNEAGMYDAADWIRWAMSPNDPTIHEPVVRLPQCAAPDVPQTEPTSDAQVGI